MPCAPPRQVQRESWTLQGLSGRLEDICRDLRRSVEHEFTLSERQLQAQSHADLEAQRLRSEANACQQQAKIENLEQEVRTTTKKLELKQKQVKESFALSMRLRQNFGARLAFERSFRAWQARAAEGKEEQLQNKLANRLQGLRLAACLFAAWRHEAQSGSREKVIAHERAAAAAVREKLFEQIKTERSQLSCEVEDLKRKLSEEGKQRALLQDNLKRVFMRGVCALNFEAMSLLSDPGAGTGVLASSVAGAPTVEGLLSETFASAEPVARLPATTAPALAEEEMASTSERPCQEAGSSAEDEALQPQVSPTPTPSPLPFVSYTGPAAAVEKMKKAVQKTRFPGMVRREELAARA